MNTTPQDQEFGCNQCWPDSAEAANAASAALGIANRLIDESHFIVLIKRCARCGQSFLSVFTEMIDWSGGDDPQYRTLLPLTPRETDALIAAGEDLTEAALNAIGKERKSLYMDFPKGAPKRVLWRTGLFVGPHD